VESDELLTVSAAVQSGRKRGNLCHRGLILIQSGTWPGNASTTVIVRPVMYLIRSMLALTPAIMTSICAASATNVSWPGPKVVELAPGIVQFISPDLAGNVDGNSIAIVTDRDVVLFDATILPATADAVLNELRQLTPKPLRYLVNSHWHPDHSGGNDEIAKAYPEIEIIASQRTRELMQDTASVYVKTLEFEAAQANHEIDRELKSGRTSDGHRLTPKDRAELNSQLALAARFLAEFKATPSRLPTLTFGDTLTLFHGGRELRFFRLPGHTAGDVAVFLPAEKILLTGDLLVYPVPFCADSHPSAWIASLETLSRLDARIIVPGHGQAQPDASFLQLVLDSFRSIRQQVRDALHRGLTLQETQKAIDLAAIRTRFTHDDPDLNEVFDGNFTPIVRQFYDEATEGLEQYQ
jgi:cyclase